MNRDLQLQLLAYVDGELSGREVRRIDRVLAEDPEARSLVEEIRMTKRLLSGHEAEVKLPESREFYWSKIEKAIGRAEEAATGLDDAGFNDTGFNWRKLVAPLAGLAAVVALGFAGLHFTDYAPFQNSIGQLAEVENESEHMGSFSFRSQSGNMFVVWIYDRTPEAEAEPEIQPVLDDDTVIQ
jgi:anti-sigma-K factor RskA